MTKPEEIFCLSQENLKMLRSASQDLFYILKPIFEKNKKGYRPYGSVADYKQKRELRFRHPENYYTFSDDNVVILISLRRGIVYSVAVTGVTLHSDLLKLLSVPDEFLSKTEREFSAGFTFYGRFDRNHFSDVVSLWSKCVVQYIFQKFDVPCQNVIKQLEFIF